MFPRGLVVKVVFIHSPSYCRHLLFVGEVEAEGFAVEDIGPRHEEGGACEVVGDGIILGYAEEIG